MIKGRILDVTEKGVALIEASINPTEFIRKKSKECYIDLIDDRPLSEKQRKMCYALTSAIADFAGESLENTHLDRKFAFTVEKAEEIPELTERLFSLASASMSLIVEYQKYLIKFVLDNDIPTKRPLLEYVDDIDHYVYMCVINKKCAICGKKADLHHLDAVGMGRDRTQINHLGLEAMSLCRAPHAEMHTVGKQAFFEKYHFNKGVEIDKTICKIYGLKK